MLHMEMHPTSVDKNHREDGLFNRYAEEHH